MSGSGRRSQYRKSVTTNYLLDNSIIPLENEEIVKIVNNLGTNQFEIINQYNETSIALLPNKFKKLLWIKRGDYVIVESNNNISSNHSDNNSNNNQINHMNINKIQYIIKVILNKDQIKNIKSQNLWPNNFTEDLPACNSNNIIDSNDNIKSNSYGDLMPGYDSNDDKDDNENNDKEDLVDKEI